MNNEENKVPEEKVEIISEPKKVNLEIERKFLLKKVPMQYLSKVKHELLDISQYYFLINDVWERYRVVLSKEETKYIHTVKKYISHGVCEEDEKEVTKQQFELILNEHRPSYKLLRKSRFVIKRNGLKFEIDVYQGLSLVTLEVELPKIDFIFTTPKEIKELILLELTGMNRFSNLSLADSKFEKRLELDSTGNPVSHRYHDLD